MHLSQCSWFVKIYIDTISINIIYDIFLQSLTWSNIHVVILFQTSLKASRILKISTQWNNTRVKVKDTSMKKKDISLGNWVAALAASMVGSTSVVPERSPGVGRVPSQVQYPSRDRCLLVARGGWGLFVAQAPEPSKPISVLLQHSVYYHVHHWNLILWEGTVKHQKERRAKCWIKSQTIFFPHFQMKKLNVYFLVCLFFWWEPPSGKWQVTESQQKKWKKVFHFTAFLKKLKSSNLWKRERGFSATGWMQQW